LISLALYCTSTTHVYTLPLHDALPICRPGRSVLPAPKRWCTLSALLLRAVLVVLVLLGSVAQASDRLTLGVFAFRPKPVMIERRSEEHTSELQSRENIVCRLLLEKKKR